MTEQQKDLLFLAIANKNVQERKDHLLCYVIHSQISLAEYAEDCIMLDQTIDEMQFRYITKYQIIESIRQFPKFNLSPEDLTKFNYN